MVNSVVVDRPHHALSGSRRAPGRRCTAGVRREESALR